MPKITEDQVPLAAEDRFLIVSIQKAESLCPGENDAAALGKVIEVAKPFLGDLTPLFDLRGLPTIYNDVDIFINEVASPGSYVLLNSRTAKQIDVDYLRKRRGLNVLSVKGHSYRARHFDMSNLNRDDLDDPFFGLSQSIVDTFAYEGRSQTDFDIDAKVDYDAPSLEEMCRLLTPKKLSALVRQHFPDRLWCGIKATEFAHSIRTFFPKIEEALAELDSDPESAEFYFRPAMLHAFYRKLHRHSLLAEFYLHSALLHAFLRKLHRNSLLVEFVITTDGNSIACAPYHASALHEIARPRPSDILVGRPGVLATKTAALFSEEIGGLQELLNDKATRERHIQKFLEDHPNFLRGLNYNSIYPQLVLQRSDGSKLRPDFILEPYDDMWCDILDIKLPNQSIIVGRKDRATLAAGIHEVAAQLREYAAYFEEERHRKWVLEKFGLRVYKPRLIAVVGRDIRQMSDPEIRRAMTAYNDVQVMTFDQMIRHAQSRLLL